MLLERKRKINTPFFSLRRRAEDAASALPALIANAQAAASSVLAGDHAQRRTGTGEKFWQFREYDPADRPQDIDWRQSAKGDRVYIRQKEWQTTQTVLFWCQRNEAMEYTSGDWPSKQEAAITLSLALAILLARGGEQVGLADGSIRPGRSELSLERLGTHIFEGETGAMPDHAEAIRMNSSLVLAGDFLCPVEEIEAAFKMLGGRASGATVIQILDPAEISLPFDGRVVFEQTGDRTKYNVEHVASIRAAYTSRIEAHREAIKRLCRRNGWRYLLHTTNTPLKATLFDAWMMIAPESVHGGGTP